MRGSGEVRYVEIEFGRYLSKPISVEEVTRGCGGGPSYLRWVCNPKGSERVLFLEVPKTCCPERIWFCDIRFIRYPLSECFFFFFFFFFF